MEGCERTRALLPAYALGEGEEADRVVVAGHLAACEACRREEARVAHAVAAMRAMPELPASAMRKERALAAARAGVETPRRRRLAWVAAVAAVAAVAVVAFALRGTVRRTEAFALTVEKVEGTVEREEAGRWAAVAAGAPLGEGTRLRTVAGRATLRSSRGDLVVLDVESELAVQATTEAEEGILLQTGRLWCEAKKRSGRRLVIRTPIGRVEVVGTRFEVTYR